MANREHLFYYAAIALACFALWRSVQGQFTSPDSEPVFVATSEAESIQHQKLVADYGYFTSPKVPASSPLANANLSGGRQVYAVNCLHCHGSSGRANTPTAALLKPPPKDLFAGTVRDIETVLRYGIPSTSMSSFAGLSDDEFADVRDYALYIVERGAAWAKLTEGNE